MKGIETILNWTDPGPGGFYDDLGNVARQPHLVRGPGFAKDPATLLSPRVGFAYRSERRMSQINHAEPLYDAPLQMRYTGLDPKAHYKVRAVYAGDNFRVKMRLVANDATEVHPFLAKDPQLRPVEFDIPPEATRTGTLLLSWFQEPGRGGNGRGCQVAEVWLIRK